MKYVLIIFMAWSKAGGPSTAEFGDQKACENARAVVMEEKWPQVPAAALAVCVPYASEESR